jgi:hypothetical protein
MTKPNTNPPVIFDIDMTLTSEWYVNDQVKELKACRPMLDLSRDLQREGVPILISTARPERLRGDSLIWLWSVGVYPENVYMRKNHDNRPDHFAKEDQIDEILEKYGNVLFWFDDNEDNCKLAQKRGIQNLLVKQNKNGFHLEVQASRERILRALDSQKRRKSRKLAMRNLSAFRTESSSMTPREQEELANFLVDQLKSKSPPCHTPPITI